MRSRGAITVLLVTVLAGCGSSSSSKKTTSAGASPSRSGSSGVTLQTLGGTENLNATACGQQEPFEHYSSPAQVRYTGTIAPAPSGRWKVKVKLKLCQGSSFVDSGSQKIVGQPSGRFDGVFGVSKPGYYSLRAELEGSSPKPQSPKLYLKVG